MACAAPRTIPTRGPSTSIPAGSTRCCRSRGSRTPTRPLPRLQQGDHRPRDGRRTVGQCGTNNFPQMTIDMSLEWTEHHRDGAPQLYPEHLRAEIDEVNAGVFTEINNGVYRCGFAAASSRTNGRTRASSTTSTSSRRGCAVSDSWWATPSPRPTSDCSPLSSASTPVYHGHFKCNRMKLSEMPVLWAYARDLFQTPGFGDTVDFTQIKRHYYVVHSDINPTGIVPLGRTCAAGTPRTTGSSSAVGRSARHSPAARRAPRRPSHSRTGHPGERRSRRRDRRRHRPRAATPGTGCRGLRPPSAVSPPRRVPRADHRAPREAVPDDGDVLRRCGRRDGGGTGSRDAGLHRGDRRRVRVLRRGVGAPRPRGGRGPRNPGRGGGATAHPGARRRPGEEGSPPWPRNWVAAQPAGTGGRRRAQRTRTAQPEQDPAETGDQEVRGPPRTAEWSARCCRPGSAPRSAVSATARWAGASSPTPARRSAHHPPPGPTRRGDHRARSVTRAGSRAWPPSARGTGHC